MAISPTYPGHLLQNGSQGTEVARMQKYLNALRTIQPTIPALSVDGKFGSGTENAVKIYQAINLLQVDGKIGQNTWNSIVSQTMALTGWTADTYPGISMQNGSQSQDVMHMQQALNANAAIYTAINTQTVDGKFGNNNFNATQRFQLQFGLSVDGVIGPASWNAIITVRNALTTSPIHVITPYGGLLQVGSSGNHVRCAQSYLNRSMGVQLTIDGQFGTNTKNATVAFQASHGLTADGKIGSQTWPVLVIAFNNML